MSRLCLILLLSISIFASGCAKKAQPPVEEAPVEPVVVSEPAKAEEPAPVMKEEQDPLQEAGIFALEASSLEKVYFAYDSYQLSGEAMSSLQKNAELMQADPAFMVTIEGHCDERGSDEYNLSLGELRGNAVKGYLASLGIAEDRMKVVSYGEERPAVNGSHEAAWAKNRRVEFE